MQIVVIFVTRENTLQMVENVLHVLVDKFQQLMEPVPAVLVQQEWNSERAEWVEEMALTSASLV